MVRMPNTGWWLRQAAKKKNAPFSLLNMPVATPGQYVKYAWDPAGMRQSQKARDAWAYRLARAGRGRFTGKKKNPRRAGPKPTQFSGSGSSKRTMKDFYPSKKQKTGDFQSKVKDTFDQLEKYMSGEKSLPKGVPTRRITPEFNTGTRKRKTLIVGDMPRRFKKIKRAKPGMQLSYKYEEYATLTRTNVAYVGMTSIGGHKRMLKPVVAQLLRKLLKQAEVQVLDHHQPPELPANSPWDRVRWFANHRTNSGSIQEADFRSAVTFAGKTFDALVDALTDELILTTEVTDPFWEITELRLLNSSNQVYFRLNRLDHMVVDVIVKQTMDIQNQCRDDEGDANKDSVLANPVKGRLYSFDHQFPRKRDGIHQVLPFEANDAKFRQGLLETGTDTDSIYKTPDHAAAPPVYNYLFTPPNGKQIWTNCKGQVSVSLSPGRHKKFATYFRFRGYLKTLLMKMSHGKDANNYSLPRFGTCKLLGLEPVMRTSNTEIVTLGCQKEQICSATIKFARMPGLPSMNVQGSAFSA